MRKHIAPTLLGLCHAVLVSGAVLLFAVRPAWANGYDEYPAPLAWSPDSRYLLAAFSDVGPSDGLAASGELRLYDTTHPESYTALAYGVSASPCWSADGRRFAAVSGGKLLVYQLSGSNNSAGSPNAIGLGSPIPNTDVIDCCFNPRAGQPGEAELFFSAGEQYYGADIFAVFPDSGIRVIVGSSKDESFTTPLALADGRLLYNYQPGAEGNYAYERIFILDREHPLGVQLTGPSVGPPISPEEYHECYALASASGMIFQRGGWGDWSLYRAAADGSPDVLLLADAQQPSLSADSCWLAYSHVDAAAKARQEYDWELPSTVWLSHLDGSNARQFSSEANVNAAFPAVAPDGSQLAWVEWPLPDENGQLRSAATLRFAKLD